MKASYNRLWQEVNGLRHWYHIFLIASRACINLRSKPIAIFLCICILYRIWSVVSSDIHNVVDWSSSLKRKCHFDEIAITGCTGSFHFDNFLCSPRWKSNQNDIIFRVSVCNVAMEVIYQALSPHLQYLHGITQNDLLQWAQVHGERHYMPRVLWDFIGFICILAHKWRSPPVQSCLCRCQHRKYQSGSQFEKFWKSLSFITWILGHI